MRSDTIDGLLAFRSYPGTPYSGAMNIHRGISPSVQLSGVKHESTLKCQVLRLIGERRTPCSRPLVHGPSITLGIADRYRVSGSKN